MNDYNLSSWKVEAGKLEVQGHLKLHSVGCLKPGRATYMRPHFKILSTLPLKDNFHVKTNLFNSEKCL